MRPYIIAALAVAVLPFACFAQEDPGNLEDDEEMLTPAEAAEAYSLSVARLMLKMAGVGKGDVLYDLGCGDGRVAITGASEFGCRGVGIDTDHIRLEQGRQNARKAGVSDRVEFIETDLGSVPLSSASVVSLYLLPRQSAAIRPKLLAELKPGTRLVARDFDLGEWKPDGQARLGDSRVYYWIVPSNVSGTWVWQGGRQRYSMKVDQVFQKGTASLAAFPAQGKAVSLRVEADKILFTISLEYAARERTINFEGTVTGDIMQGFAEEEGIRTPWKAVRKPGTMRPIDGS
ncbi:MAG: SAM-dependent methyltransferase [Deltaproteobacteria bacterium]